MSKVTPIIDWSTLKKSGQFETRKDTEGNIEEYPHIMGSVDELDAVAIHPETGSEISGTFVYSPAAGDEVRESQIITATFTPDDTVTYNTASKEVSFMVQIINKGPAEAMKMFGAYVEDFSSSASYGSQGGSCQLTLVEDPDNNVVFDPPAVGTACYFKYGGLFFGGVFQRWTYNESISGRKYDVILESPGGKILNGVNVILSGFDGGSYNYGANNSFNYDYGTAGNPLVQTASTATSEFPPSVNNPIFSNSQGLRNIYNVLAHEENYYLAGENGDGVSAEGSGYFGDAETNSAGFPVRRLLDIIESMSRGNSNFGDKIFFGESEYEIDLSAIKIVPENFRISNQITNIISIIEECCELIQYNYILTIEPKDGIGSISDDGGDVITDPVIIVKTIDRTAQPTPGAIRAIVQQEKNKGTNSKLISSSIGEELSDESVQKMVVGAPATRYLINDVPGMAPVWGKTDKGRWVIQPSVFSGCPITMPEAYDPDSPVDVIVDYDDLTFFYRATIDELRMATQGQNCWRAFKTFESVKNGTWETDPWIADLEVTEEILNLVADNNLGPLGLASTSLTTAKLAYNPKEQKKNGKFVDAIFKGVQNCANNFLGRMFLTTVPEEPGGRDNNLKYKNERPLDNYTNNSDQVPAWENASSAWVEEKPVQDIAFYENDGKLKMMAVWPGSDLADYSSLGGNYGAYIYNDYAGIASTQASYASDFVYWTSFKASSGDPCGIDPNENGLAGVVVDTGAQVKIVDQWTGPRMGVIYFAWKFFNIEIKEEHLNRFSSGLANITVPKKIIAPDWIGLPQQSNKYSWGPWFDFDATNGRSEVVFDTSLAPESFGSTDTMNDMGASYASSGNAEVTVSESGSLELALPPQYNLVDRFASSGPYITNISGKISVSGNSTTYQFNSYTPNFGKLAKYNADRLSRIYKDTIGALKNIRDRLQKKNLFTSGSRFSFESQTERDKRNRDNGTAIGMTGSLHGAAALPYRSYQGGVSDLNDVFGLSYNATADDPWLSYKNSFSCSQEQLFSPYQISKNKDTDSDEVPRFEKVDISDEAGSFSNNSIVASADEYDPYFPVGVQSAEDDGSEYFANSDYHSVINEVETTGDLTQNLQVRRLEDAEQVKKIRSIGLRGPVVVSGRGYDLANNPVPSVDGDIQAYDTTATDDRSKFLTGPVKMMWDKERKVWSGGHDIIAGILKTDITSPDDPLTPTTFELEVLRKISNNKGTGALELQGETITGYNRDPGFSLSAGDDVFLVCQRINYEWLPLSASGGCDYILFTITGPSDVEEAASNDCTDKLEDAENNYEATVDYKSCGCGSVPGEVDGVVTVNDSLGSFLSEREEAEIVGKQGAAVYLKTEEEYSECQWVIVWIDWFREVIMITDVRIGAGSNGDDALIFDRKRVEVWDDCDLEPIEIPLTDCEDEYY